VITLSKPLSTSYKRKRLPLLLGASIAVMLGGCATGPNANPADPLEPFNRAVFGVNDKLDQYVAVPLAKGYQAVTPSFAQTAVNNFLGNLGDVGNTINNFLQGKGNDGVASLTRLLVNSLFGIGGLIDVGSKTGLPKHPQDFGLTLGTWGLASGPYLVLPLFGPSSFRDGAGMAGDVEIDPTRYMQTRLRNTLYGLNFVSTRANYLGATDLLSQAALDRYSFVRDAYLEQRRYRLGKDGADAKLPDYDDPDDKAGPGTPAPVPAPAGNKPD